MRLTPRLTLYFILYAAILLAVVGLLAYKSGRDSLRATTISELLSTAIEKQAALDAWVDEKQNDIHALANDPVVIEVAAALFAEPAGSTKAKESHTRLAAEFQPRVRAGEFRTVFLMDPESGEVLAASDPSEVGKFKEDRSFYMRGRAEANVQNLYYSIELQGPAMTAAAPLRAADGELLGVLAGRLDLEELNAIINRRSGLRQTDDAYLVNTSNLAVTQPRFLADAAVLRRGLHTAAINRCLEGQNGVLEARDYRGVPVISVYRWLDERDLCLLVELDQAEAYAPVRAFGVTIVVVSILVLLAAAAAAAGLSRSLTRPILALQAGAARFGAGDLALRLPETRGDELGDLARAFNQMATALAEKELQLRRYAGELEKRVEERTAELSESEERYRGTLDNMLEGCQIIGFDWRYVYVNEAGARQGKQPKEALLGRSMMEVYPGIEQTWMFGVLQECMHARVARQIENEFTFPDGSKGWFELNIQPAPEGIFILSFDVTERKQAEETIHSLARFPSENPNPVLRIDRKGILLYANQGAIDLFGDWNLEEGSPAPEVLRSRVSEVLRERREITIEIPYTERIISMSISPAPNAEDVNLYGRDITEGKQAEEALQASEARYRHTLDAMLEGCQILGHDWRYLYLNEVADKHNRRPKEELLGKVYMEMWPGIEATEVFQVIRRCMVERVSQSLENKFIFPDGSEGWFDLRIYPVPEGIVILSVDITERKKAEEELKRYAETLSRANTDLERSNKELEQFAYVASHDLQEPLRMISSYVQLLAKRYQGKLDQDADEFIDYAVEGAKRLQSLINDLLAYSRVGTRGNPFIPIASEELLIAALTNLKIVIEETGAEITHDPLPVLTGDPGQLTMIFQNLVSNAIKFRGEQPPCIHVGMKQEKQEWVFAVRDNGIGIDSQFAERVFVIFQRLHERAAYPGTGIGLAICKRIVQRHGGRIWVESQPGQGATFYFTIPMKETA